ncbi:MAG: hypothetical protein ACFFCQ_06995 [Promethearchaeota archaeon]
MSFIQTIKEKLGLGGKAPIDDAKKQRIEEITKRSVENWKPEYNAAYQEIVQEWEDEGRQIIHKEVDKEAKKRTSVEELKMNISEEAKTELMDDIRKELPENEMARKAGEKAAEKAIEKTVDKSVDKLVDQFSKEKEEESTTA